LPAPDLSKLGWEQVVTGAVVQGNEAEGRRCHAALFSFAVLLF